jgi:patatin-like phospholipase/acyl hydrolase
MSYKIRTRDEHFQNDGSPKRILALDGGGLRGILTLSILAEIEGTLKQRHDDQEKFRLCHYFDLIAGTSTGAIIAAALAQGMTVSEITEKYFNLGHKVFKKSLFRKGLIRALYDYTKLTEELQAVFGETTTLGSPTLETGVLIVTKRLDSGSPWPISNNPRGKYYGPRRDSDAIPNAEYPLWQVVRASTAAPRYFEPEHLEIIKAEGKKSVIGEFVDGGVSPFNNPALQAFMYATMDGYRVGWPTGANKILLVSVGTGTRDPAVNPASLAATNAVKRVVT